MVDTVRTLQLITQFTLKRGCFDSSCLKTEICIEVFHFYYDSSKNKGGGHLSCERQLHVLHTHTHAHARMHTHTHTHAVQHGRRLKPLQLLEFEATCSGRAAAAACPRGLHAARPGLPLASPP